MNKNPKDLKVFVTQCKICNTLSIHYGRLTTNGCTLCSEVAEVEAARFEKELNEQIMLEEKRMLDMLNGLPQISAEEAELESHKDHIQWDAKKEELPADLKAEIDALADSMASMFIHDTDVTELIKKVNTGGTSLHFDALELTDYAVRAPLLHSVRASFATDYATMNDILDRYNVKLGVINDNIGDWRYLSEIEVLTLELEAVVDKLNGYIEEIHQLGFDVTDLEGPTFSALAMLPVPTGPMANYPWIDPVFIKDLHDGGHTACLLYFGETEEAAFSLTSLDGQRAADKPKRS